MKSGPSEAERVRAFRAKLDRPFRLVITGATAYWLEHFDGRLLTDEAPTSDLALAQVLASVATGADPKQLRLMCRGADFDRYEISRGMILVDLAEGAAGIPAAPRSLRVTPESPRVRGTSSG
jgi:hypothetical protein